MIGLGGLAGVIPLSILNSAQIQGLNVSCTAADSCTASATLQNVNVTGGSLTVWFAVHDQNNANVFIGSQQVSVNPGSSQPVSMPINFNPNNGIGGAPGGGIYTLSAYALSNLGNLVSYTASVQFSPNPLLIVIPWCNGSCGTTSTVPAGTNVACPTTVAQVYPGSFCATYPLGTSVTMLERLPALAGGTVYTGPGFTVDCTILGSSIPCVNQGQSVKNNTAFVMSRSYGFRQTTNVQSASTNSFVIVGASVYGGTWAPAYGATLTSASQPVTFTFTQMPNTTYINYHITGWSLVAQCGAGITQTVKKGTNTSFSVSWPLVSPFVNSGCNYGNIVSSVSQKFFNSLVITAQSGITTSPAPGRYYYANQTGGKPVTVSETTASGYCFVGWVFDGQNLGNKSSITVTVTGQDALLASSLTSTAGKCPYKIPPPPPPPVAFPSLTALLLTLGGGIGIALGWRMKGKGEPES